MGREKFNNEAEEGFTYVAIVIRVLVNGMFRGIASLSMSFKVH